VTACAVVFKCSDIIIIVLNLNLKKVNITKFRVGINLGRVVFQKTGVFISTAVRASNLSQLTSHFLTILLQEKFIWLWHSSQLLRQYTVFKEVWIRPINPKCFCRRDVKIIMKLINEILDVWENKIKCPDGRLWEIWGMIELAFYDFKLSFMASFGT